MERTGGGARGAERPRQRQPRFMPTAPDKRRMPRMSESRRRVVGAGARVARELEGWTGWRWEERFKCIQVHKELRNSCNNLYILQLQHYLTKKLSSASLVFHFALMNDTTQNKTSVLVMPSDQLAASTLINGRSIVTHPTSLEITT